MQQPGKGQNRIKDYSGWRISHIEKERIDGKTEDIMITHPDIEGIRDDIMKTPLSRKEHPKKQLRRGMPKAKK